ncbi:MAG: hypothetical protein LC105_00150 [Chitinophagales bacterium]|nr:hypothetical protein [Chitinophagales bacterium]MCZ2392255.1 hypothetical protein [Chitinophagales bacterium]
MMKDIIKFILGAFLVLSIFSVDAKPKKELNLPEKLNQKIEKKIDNVSKDMANELGLSERQTRKVYDIKLLEAREIEALRLNKSKSQKEISNGTILIKNDTEKKVEKVLKKKQKPLWEAKKSDFEYNQGLLEKLKDLYHKTKEELKKQLRE